MDEQRWRWGSTRIAFEDSDIPSGNASFPFASRRTGKRAWTVTGFGGDFTAETDLTAIAYCAKDKLGLKARSAQAATTTDNDELFATATCKKNERVVSGGVEGIVSDAADDEFVGPIGSFRVGKRDWATSIGAYNSGSGSSVELKAFAYCLKKNALD
jgi:hypothetical protein